MTFREVIARLDELPGDETIFAASTAPGARAVVARERDDGAPPEPGLRYVLEVELAREAVAVWRRWRPDRAPSLDDRVAAVSYYADNDAWLPVE